MVQVRSKVPGSSGDDLPEVLVGLATEVTTAAELIRLAVEEQIRLLRGDAGRCQSALDRQYLSMEDIREQAAVLAVRRRGPDDQRDPQQGALAERG